MTKEEITRELKDLAHNIRVLERTEIGMGNYKSVMQGYQKVLRDLLNVVVALFENGEAKNV